MVPHRRTYGSLTGNIENALKKQLCPQGVFQYVKLASYSASSYSAKAGTGRCMPAITSPFSRAYCR